MAEYINPLPEGLVSSLEILHTYDINETDNVYNSQSNQLVLKVTHEEYKSPIVESNQLVLKVRMKNINHL